MKIKDLIEELQCFNENNEIVIQTQNHHALYGDVGSMEEDDENESIIIMQFRNEGYSPEQALRRE